MKYFVLLTRSVLKTGKTWFGTVLAIDESGEKAMAAYNRYMKAKYEWEAVSFFETNALASIEETVTCSDNNLCSFPNEAVLRGKPWLGINSSILSEGGQ